MANTSNEGSADPGIGMYGNSLELSSPTFSQGFRKQEAPLYKIWSEGIQIQKLDMNVMAP